MSKPKLTYFDFSGSRGEECRMALFAAGVDFDDDRIERAQWSQLKPNTPYGSLPILTLEGGRVLGQTNAILNFIGRGHGLAPEDNWQVAVHDAIMASVEELRATVMKVLRQKDEESKESARKELADGPMQLWASQIERQIEGPFLAGASMCVADIKLFVVCDWFSKGVVDHVPTDVFAKFPKLVRLAQAVAAHPRIAEWRAR